MGVEVVAAIRDDPHWRIRVRPAEHDGQAIATLGECWRVVQRNRVRLRGWDYPYVATGDQEREIAENYVGTWCDWDGHREYWRFYQSKQFIHLLSLIENTSPSYREAFQSRVRSRLRRYGEDRVDSIRGYVGFIDLLYTMTQVFEFAVRLSLREVYKGQLYLDLQLNNVKDFILGTADPLRAWHGWNMCQQESLTHPRIELDTVELIGSHPAAALAAAKWFYERFAWADPSDELLRAEQARLLSGFRDGWKPGQ